MELTMKTVAVAALSLSLLAVAAPAQAKLVTGTAQRVVAVSVDDTAIATGPAGTLLESNYFNAPQAAPAGYGSMKSCRLPLSLFEKTRLARACN